MRGRGIKVNLVLGGGGIKGLAYAGVFEAGERMGFRWGNIAGVSSGSLAGAYIAAGYTSREILKILSDYDFSSIKLKDIQNKVPAVRRFMEYYNDGLVRGDKSVEQFLYDEDDSEQGFRRGNFYTGRGFIKNLIKYSKEGCLFNGDQLEEWVYGVLQKRGVKTFQDLRCGICDKVNPRGYVLRMTAVDATRKKIVVLPDDMAFYGINPDSLEVAHAIRMSTSVPFAFKPVEVKYMDGGVSKTCNFIDGGVLDNFPAWLISDSKRIPTAGFKLSSDDKKKILSLDTPLNILKSMISATHNTGLPEKETSLAFSSVINTSKVKFLDFDIDEQEKEYLYNAGKRSGMFLFDSIRRKYGPMRFNIFELLQRLFAG